MKLLRLVREELTEISTVGSLWGWNDERACYTLEDRVRPDGIKIPGETAIPAGEYEIAITWSERFQQPMPLLLRVPMFEGIRIHPGNTAKDTHGCILVGFHKLPDRVTDSKAAFHKLFLLISIAMQTDKVFLRV